MCIFLLVNYNLASSLSPSSHTYTRSHIHPFTYVCTHIPTFTHTYIPLQHIHTLHINTSAHTHTRTSPSKKKKQDACFQQLRTVEQLGYVVKCFGAVHETSGSLQTLVQSIDYTPQRVLGSIDSFLHSFLDTHLLNISSDGDTFSLQVNILRAKLLRRDLTIDEKTNRLWTQINTGMEQFDWNQQTVDVLARLSPSSLVEFYRQLVTDASRYRKMAIVVYGRGRDSNLSTFNFTYPLDYARLDQNRTTLP